MQRMVCLVVAAAFLASCSNSGTTSPGALDTSLRNVDSSKVINNTSRLSQDSTTMVTQ